MASGDTLLEFVPQSAEFPASDAATPDERNNHPVLDFDPTTDESVYFSGVMPQNYGGGGVTVYFHYAMSSATSGNVTWSVSWERIGDQQQDLDSDGFYVSGSNNEAVPATCGHVGILSIGFADGANMDNVAAGEGFRLQVSRGGLGDTASGDAELLFVELRES